MSLLEAINELGPDKTELIHSETCNGELLTIRQYQSWRWLSAGGEMIQSLIDLDRPGELLLPNLKAMLQVFTFIKSPGGVLNLGACGGALERAILAKHPQIEITSVESNECIVKLAERFFETDTSDFVIETAEGFLQQNRKRFDVILIDMYMGEKHPPCLYSSDFYQQLANATTAKSVIAFNLLPESEEDLMQILKPLNEHVAWLLLHDVPNHDNMIVYALCDKKYSMQKLMPVLGEISEDGFNIEVVAQNV